MDDQTRTQAPELVGEPPTTTALDAGDLVLDEPERYLIEGQLGAGGMGVVLSAKGERLGRPVAVKVSTTDRDDVRRRFEREASVTARLQHPAIVPVYGTGRHRDGRPFYAMKAVSGQPLDKVIADADTLAKRLALLPNLIAVTEAMAYAHSERVIHRDLKPANVLVGRFGETVVIDWGLAKAFDATDDEPAVDAGPFRGNADGTAAGKVMGTPAYMPLEQARGEPVDARADVYALGAMLYHVLVGAPPYRRHGEASVAWENMLARVIAGEPEPLSDDVPPDLAAIVRRAMARKADDRYPTAEQLAEDLRRFQTGQLVGAHRYSTWQLVRRWARRNRTAVTVGAIAIAVVAVLAVVSLQRIFAEQARTEEQRVAAVESRDQAEDLLAFMLFDLRDKLQPLGRLELLDAVAHKAMAYYEGRPTGTDTDEAKRATAMANIADVLAARNDLAGALSEARAAQKIREDLAEREAVWAERHDELAASALQIGSVLETQGDTAAALASDQRAVELRTKLVAGDPKWKVGLAAAQDRVAGVQLAQGASADALAGYRAALALRDDAAARRPEDPEIRRAQASSHTSIGGVLKARADLPGALAEFRLALSIYEKLAAKDRTNILDQGELGNLHQRVATTLLGLGENKAALAELDAAVDIADRISRDDPTNALRASTAASTHASRGDARKAIGDDVGAMTDFRLAIATGERITAQDPSNKKALRNLSVVHDRAGLLLQEEGKLDEALVELRAYRDLAEQLKMKDAKNAVWTRERAVAHQRVGLVLHDQLHYKEALVELRAAEVVMEELTTKDTKNARYRADIASNRGKIGNTLEALEDYDGAMVEYKAARDVAERLMQDDPKNTEWPSLMLGLEQSIGELLEHGKDPTGAISEYRRLVGMVEKLTERDPTNLAWRRHLAAAHVSIAQAMHTAHDYAGALVEGRTALAIALEVVKEAPKNVTNQLDLEVAYEAIGDSLWDSGDHPGAIESWKLALGVYDVLGERVGPGYDKWIAKLRNKAAGTPEKTK